jgi:hypothetical protein
VRNRQLIAQTVVEGQGHEITAAAGAQGAEVLVERDEREAALQEADGIRQQIGFLLQDDVRGKDEARAVAPSQSARDAGRMQRALDGSLQGHRLLTVSTKPPERRGDHRVGTG